MSTLVDLLRSAGARGGIASTTIAINNGNQQIGANPVTGGGRLIVAGGLRAAIDASVEVWDGVPDSGASVLLDTLPLVAAQAMPLALWCYYSTTGRGLWLRCETVTAVSGRVLSTEI